MTTEAAREEQSRVVSGTSPTPLWSPVDAENVRLEFECNRCSRYCYIKLNDVVEGDNCCEHCRRPMSFVGIEAKL